jgi:hypothetical protein
VRRDRRPRLLVAVLADREMSYPEKLYMIAVLHLRAEHVDGKRRTGSKAMGPDGRFTLHLDYIAAGMGRTVRAVRDARAKLEESGWLSRVHEGTHGRPACYQALLAQGAPETVRVRFYSTLTNDAEPHPYESEHPAVRVTQNRTLTYKTPDHPGHPPAIGVSLPPVTDERTPPSVLAAVDRVHNELRSKETGS